MKRILLFLVAFICLFTGCSVRNSGTSSASAGSSAPVNSSAPSPSQTVAPSPSQTKEPDFRNINWGMTKDEVINSEGAKPDGSDSGTIYYNNVNVAGYTTTLVYQFNNDVLIRGAYFINSKHTNLNDYIDDFNSLKEMLTTKYGKPNADSVKWKNDLFKDDPEYYGTAVAAGDLEYLTQWDLSDTQIGLRLYGDNYEITFIILYQDAQASDSVPANTNGL